MKTGFRKISSSFIFFIALLPLIFALYTLTSQAAIHHQMHEELEQKNLVTIHVKSFELVWTRTGKEASINGNMFDVKSYIIKGDDIELTGLFDKDEDGLFTHIDNTQQKNSDATTGTSVLKLFGCFSWNSNNIATQHLSSSVISSLQKNQQNNSLQNPFLSFDTPPPKLS